ncbi:SDR family NAD(P)-dependent oxidoreductase [Microbacterium sp. B2969]|uniref:SDR family NAD(P)-dependent oxidoreductase n=1 Tax=Microbacterium alkaliflavum TaxID=3248839 RepID=A0ABW7Q8N7_9MICO
MTVPEPVELLSPERLFSLAGQAAIVTGGTSGIGLACAGALAAAGARVLLAGLGDAPGVAATLQARGLEAAGVECDLTDPTVPESLVDAALERWGRLDTVFANAGAALDVPGEDPGSPEALDRLEIMFDLHVASVLRLADAALPPMAEGGGGLFLVMSSLSGLRGNRAIGGYGITKAANAQLARNIAVQWGPRGIRANALSPGVIATEFATPITGDPDAARARLAKTPLGRFGTPAEVAGAVVWLASPAGAFVSGQNIVIDGGTLASD